MTDERMTDERLDELLADAERTWLAPPETDFDALWPGVESAAFARIPGRGRRPSWIVFAAGIAAALLAGVGIGRFAIPGSEVVATAPADSSTPSTGYDGVATDLLGRTVLLLSALPEGAAGPTEGDLFASQATDLLSTTRLLLDSPAAADARFSSLLEDLELVLAQVAMLRSGRTREDIDLITDALEERDVVPRIRSAAARLAAGND